MKDYGPLRSFPGFVLNVFPNHADVGIMWESERNRKIEKRVRRQFT